MKQDREGAVLQLLSGGAAAAADLPLVDREPGRELNPWLRDRLEPLVTARPSIRVGDVQSDGAMPAEVAKRVLRQGYSSFNDCYRQGLTRDDGLGGIVSMRFSIGPNGNVTEPKIGGATTMPDPDVTGCVLRSVSAIQFPPPEHGSVTVTASIAFVAPGAVIGAPGAP